MTPMRPTRQTIALALGALALVLVVFALTRRRTPARPTARPTPHDVRRASDGGADSTGLDGGVTDAGVIPRDIPLRDVPPRDVTPAERALEDRQRDALAARIYRELTQQRRGVTLVRAVSNGGPARDTLRMQGTACSDGFNREVATAYALGQAGYALVACVRTGSRDTFVTGVPQDDPPGPVVIPALVVIPAVPARPAAPARP